MKKITSILLSIAMLLSITAGLDFSAFAGDIITSGDFEYKVLRSSWSADEGEIIESVAVSKYNGTNSNVAVPAEWNGAAVTDIWDGAFEYCNSLVSVTIPDSVTGIGEYAFYGCSSLSGITLPDCSLIIEYGAFDDTAFYNDENNWENGVLYIGSHLIKADTYFGFQGHTYTVKSETKTLAEYSFSYQDTLTDIVLPEGLLRIGKAAFYECTSLNEIVLPDTVEVIGGEAFCNCSALAKIVFPANIDEIGYDAFEGCNNVKTVILNTVIEDFLDVDEGASLRSYFPALTYAHVSENDPNYSSVDGVIFNKDKTKIVFFPQGRKSRYDIPSSVTEIENCAFEDCTLLTGVIIPSSVTSIGNSAFEDCTLLESITGLYNVTDVGSSVFDGTAYYNDKNNWENGVLYIGPCLIEASENMGFQGGTYAVKNGTRAIAGSAFSEMYNDNESALLTEITFPEGLKTIGGYAFCSQRLLKKVVFPDSVDEIRNSAFAGCEALEIVEFPEQMSFIGWEAFRQTALKSVTVPNGVKNLGSSFRYCGELTTLNIPESVITIDMWEEGEVYNPGTLIGVKSLTDINVAANNPVFSSIDGVLFNKERTELLLYPIGKTESSYTVPNGVKCIGYWTFGNGYNGIDATEFLKHIILPDSVEEIENGAFICQSLESVTIPASVTKINNNAIIAFSEDFEDLSIIIYGYENSTAQEYAKKCGHKFIALNEETNLLNAPENLELSNSTTNGVRITFDKVSGADGYEIQYYHNGEWIHYVYTGWYDKQWSGWNPSGTFDIRVRAYKKTANGAIFADSWSEVKRFYTKPLQVTGVKTASRSADGTELTLTWDAQKWSTGYCIYKRGYNNQWWLVATVYGPQNNSYTITGLTPTYNYGYKVRAFKDGPGNLGAFSEEHSTYAALPQPALYTVMSNAPGRLYVSWNPVSCSGYEVMVSTTPDFSKNNKSYYYSGENNNKVIINTAGNKYYVRVRAYYKRGTLSMNSVWTGPREITVK